MVAPKTTVEKIKDICGIELVEVQYADLPQVVRDYFESESGKFIPAEEYQRENFAKLYKFAHPNGDITYIAEQDKTYDTSKDTERLTYFADTRDGVITGYLEMRLALTNHSQYFNNKPFVGFTRTEEGYLEQGLAVRRLEVANAYALAEHDLSLNSDSLVTQEARGVWDKLISDGRAEEYDEGGKKRYRFIRPPQSQ